MTQITNSQYEIDDENNVTGNNSNVDQISEQNEYQQSMITKQSSFQQPEKQEEKQEPMPLAQQSPFLMQHSCGKCYYAKYKAKDCCDVFECCECLCCRCCKPLINKKMFNEQNMIDVIEPKMVIKQIKKIFPNIPDRVAMMFSHFADYDNNTIITKIEMDRMLDVLKAIKTQQDIVDSLFHMIDINKKGYLTVKQIRMIKRKLPAFRIPVYKYCCGRINLENYRRMMFPLQTDIFRLDQQWENKTPKYLDPKMSFVTAQGFQNEPALLTDEENQEIQEKIRQLKLSEQKTQLNFQLHLEELKRQIQDDMHQKQLQDLKLYMQAQNEPIVRTHTDGYNEEASM